MLLPGWWYVLSAENFLDRVRNTPDTLAAAPRITCPTLYIRSDQEAPDVYPAEEFAYRAAGPCAVTAIDHCDHFYVRREDQVARTVVRWLNLTLGHE